MITETALPVEVTRLIKKAVESATKDTRELIGKYTRENNATGFNYYQATESILFNYPTLKRIVVEKGKYLHVELQGKSKSIVRYTSNGGGNKDQEQVLDDLKRDKQRSFDRTSEDVIEIEKVLNQFKSRKEYIIIQLYYFGYDLDGKPREADAKPITWESITEELADKGILKEQKTARKWRTKIVKDIAVCLFGIDAALSTGLTRF